MRKLVTVTVAALALTAGVTASNADGLGSELQIDIKGGVFFPPVILANVGETVTIINSDETTHDATASDWSTGPINPGETATFTVTAGMSMCFESSYDAEMKGAVGDKETGEAPSCFVLADG